MHGTLPWPPLVLGYAGLAFWRFCLFDFSRTPDREIRTFTKPVWVVLLILGNVAGGVCWIVLGRPHRRSTER